MMSGPRWRDCRGPDTFPITDAAARLHDYNRSATDPSSLAALLAVYDRAGLVVAAEEYRGRLELDAVNLGDRAGFFRGVDACVAPSDHAQNARSAGRSGSVPGPPWSTGLQSTHLVRHLGAVINDANWIAGAKASGQR